MAWKSWVLVIILLLSAHSPVLAISKNLTCNADDFTGLTGFMDELESPIDGWWPSNSSSSYCCNWIGITCNSSSGRIIKIELPQKRLSGSFSDLISNLDQLKTLNLSDNFLKGPLPSSLFHLTHLEALDLSGNYFNGVLPVSIDLPALQVLDISDNNFKGLLPFGFCVNSTRIRVLSFSVNYFNGTIPPQFRNCNFLEHLSAASNLISGIIPDFLLTLPRLQELALDDNQFISISGIGGSFSQLVGLDVSANRISGHIPDFFHRFPNLSYFSAHSNNLSGMIPPSLSNSKTISSLNLRNNSLHGSIDFNCSVMVNLTSLRLGSNNFSGTLPATLALCQNLKVINFSRNKFVGQIPDSFKNFKFLSYLILSNCSLSNVSASLQILQHCPNLNVLVLTMNFYGEQLPSDDDLQFKAVKALVMANCRLTGSIPSWLTNITQLQLLDLSWNDLTGSIPPYLGDFKYLFYLDLSNNSLSGEIPKNITQLESLVSRDISLEEPSLDIHLVKNSNTSNRGSMLLYNQIISFPPFIDLSNNLLIGQIWPEFGNLKKLHVLNLKHNNLSGTIPSSLSDMKSIEILDLSYNNLTGTIPPSLVKLSFLSKFSVAYNNLTGIIPSGGQLSTFPTSSFEGNPGLCGDFFVKCQGNQTLLRTPTSKKKKFSVLHLFVLSGFGIGFLVSVIINLFVVRKWVS